MDKYLTEQESRRICCAMCADFVTSQGRSERAVYWQALTVAARFTLIPHAELTGKD